MCFRVRTEVQPVGAGVVRHALEIAAEDLCVDDDGWGWYGGGTDHTAV